MNTIIIAIMLGFTLLCLLPLLCYPLLLLIRKERPIVIIGTAKPLPKVTLLCAVCNGEKLIEKKISNSLELDYPKDLLEIVFASDGSTDATNKMLEQASQKYSQLKLHAFEKHQGKNLTLNQVFPHCSGDIVVLTDADAQINPDALHKLIRHFTDPNIGGVCGQRIIEGKNTELSQAQSAYIGVDSWIKRLESRSGSISSNDGKLYAVRKEVLAELPLTVTDDLFMCLLTIKQGYRFVFEPQALVYIVKPVKNIQHELIRRKRITSCSLTGIFLMRYLLNPRRYGFFAISLLINKVIRRCLPILMLVFLVGSLLLASLELFFLLFFLLQASFYLAVGVFLYKAQKGFVPVTCLQKLNETFAYFVIGNLGCLLGISDFLTGKTPKKWTPIKS